MVYIIVFFIIYIYLDLSKCINCEGLLIYNGDSIYGFFYFVFIWFLMVVVLVYKVMWVYYKIVL